jgi:hypothetical protein
MCYLVIVISAALIATASVPAYSHGKSSSEGAVSIEIASESGSAFIVIPHRNFWQGGAHIIKNYLEARRDENYAITIHNTTPERIGAVIAVDGRNIISGRRSDLKNTEAMYIVDSYGYGEYGGWRTDGDRVHKFYFTAVADSYAIRTFGDSSAMGIIAVAVYREREKPRLQYEQERRVYEPATPPPDLSTQENAQAAGDEGAGTDFGSEQYSSTIRVTFMPESAPIQKTLFKYEWREVLCRKGILSRKREARNRLWDEDSYAPFPPGYESD